MTDDATKLLQASKIINQRRADAERANKHVDVGTASEVRSVRSEVGTTSSMVFEPPIAPVEAPSLSTPQDRFNRIRLPELHIERTDLQRISGWCDAGEQIVRSAIRSSKPGATFVLWGGEGTGKTQLVVEVCRRLILNREFDRPVTIRYYDAARRFFDECLRAQTDHASDDVIESVSYCTLLFLDEIDKVHRTDTTADRLHDLVNRRYIRGLTTVLIGNFDAVTDPVDKFLPKTVLGRARESGAIIEFDWPSFRGRVQC